MAFRVRAALAALCVAFAASQAHLPGEIHWNSKLPDVTMPRAISDALASVKAGKAEEILPEEPGKNVLFYGYHGEVLDTDKNDVAVNPPSSRFFLEKDLVPGKQMEMDFTRPDSVGYVFVPHQVANSIPFSSDKLSVILAQLSIDPESPKAQLMKDTLKYCDFPAGVGEVKTCATSVEAMIDFSIQRLGKNIQAVSTEPEKYTKLHHFTRRKTNRRQQSRVLPPDGLRIRCVLYCHDVIGAKAYVVPLIGTRGTKVKAVALCHINTSSWNPEHLAFKVLNVKPDSEPVCHFFP